MTPLSSYAAGPTIAIGTLAVLVPGSKPGNGIEVPDVKMELRDAQNAVVATGTTQIDGGFRLKAPAPETYRVCWNILGHAGCGQPVRLREGANSLRRIETRLEAALVFGRVLTADQRPCWVNDPFFKLAVYTRVNLLDSQGQLAAKPVHANARGHYLFAPTSTGRFVVHATCEKAEAKANVTTAVPAASATNLTLPTHAPRILELAANDGGKSRVRFAPAVSLNLVATVRDRDGDPVDYIWGQNDGQPIVAGNIRTLTRAAPPEPGLQSTYLIARDGRGGYAWKRIDLEIGPAQIRISGIAIDETTRAPVANATAEFGGLTTTTNAQGWFSLTGPTNADDRYVLNIRHPNYAAISRVYDRSSTGNTYELIVAQVTQHQPTQAIDITDTRSSGPCGGTPAGTTGQVRRLQTVEYVDPDRTDVRPLPAELIKRLTAPRDCRNLGA